MHVENQQIKTADDRKIVCPRYETVYEYIRVTDRPLTGLEQRAFLHLLDLDLDERYTHGPECICMELLPAIVKAISPEPLTGNAATRSLDGETYQSQRYHTEQIGRMQGVTVSPRIQKEHTAELRKLVRRQIRDLECVLQELLRRPSTDYTSRAAMIESEFPQLARLMTSVLRRQRRQKQPRPASSWDEARLRIEEDYRQQAECLKMVRQTMAAWSIATAD